jgi:cytochrome bd-type quinol oxidase subunit 2
MLMIIRSGGYLLMLIDLILFCARIVALKWRINERLKDTQRWAVSSH